MVITDIEPFLDYYSKIRARTLQVIAYIPPDQIEWTFRPGTFTPGDLIRHIAGIERYLYAEIVAGRIPAYQGCGAELAPGYQTTIDYMNRLHAESMDIFSILRPSDLQQKCRTPDGGSIVTWKWLRAMVEHEVHHRGQIYLYLNMLQVKTPPIFGMTSEQLITTGTTRTG